MVAPAAPVVTPANQHVVQEGHAMRTRLALAALAVIFGGTLSAHAQEEYNYDLSSYHEEPALDDRVEQLQGQLASLKQRVGSGGGDTSCGCCDSGRTCGHCCCPECYRYGWYAGVDAV